MSDPAPIYAIRRPANALPPAPRSLRAKGKAFWKTVVDQFELENYQLVTLRLACECLDRIEDARAAIQKYGVVIEARSGLVKSNPAAEVEKNNKVTFARLMREIGLDAILDTEVRPKPLYSGRRRN